MEQTTIKALASEIGVSKVSVSKRIESLGLKDQLIKDNNRFLVPGEVAEKVIESYKGRKTTKAEKSADADRPKRAETNPDFADIIEVLKGELEEKNRQIERLQLLLNQQQQLMLNQPGGAVVDAEEVSGHEESTSVVADVSDPDRKEPIWAIVGKFFSGR